MKLRRERMTVFLQKARVETLAFLVSAKRLFLIPKEDLGIHQFPPFA